jgi:hypothetical protein
MQFFDILVDIEVRDVAHLTDIIAALRATPPSTPPTGPGGRSGRQRKRGGSRERRAIP